MKRARELFRLTNAEQRVVVLLILALIALAIFQKHREQTVARPVTQSSIQATEPKATDAD